tara:strand:+ start:6318 stop:6803 length:486 start_codon:yes stop_codon:yes gene_type:complete
MLTYEPESPGSEHILFRFEVTPVNHPAMPSGLPPLSFLILEDCKVTMLLDPKKKWRWSSQYFVISGKDNYRSVYGDVNIVSDREFYFFAKHNKKNQHHHLDTHSFNLNIDYQQGNNKWLPITIDPDVGNPKPPESILEDKTIIKGDQKSFFTTLTGTIDET